MSVLRYAGSKKALVFPILEQLEGFGKQRLIEPFCGTGVVSALSMSFDSIWLNDSAPDLINWHKYLKTLKLPKVQTKKDFTAMKEKFNQCSRKGKKAAQMYWDINMSVHRGLMNYGASGQFIGCYGGENMGNKVDTALLEDYLALEARYTCFEYTKVLKKAGPDDCVFIDPPYFDSTSRYGKEYFGPDQQAELATAIQGVSARGARVVVTNYNTPYTRFLYDSADYQINLSSRSLNLKKNNTEAMWVWE